MRGVTVLLKYILGILLKGREIVNHSTLFRYYVRGPDLSKTIFFLQNTNTQYICKNLANTQS